MKKIYSNSLSMFFCLFLLNGESMHTIISKGSIPNINETNKYLNEVG